MAIMSDYLRNKLVDFLLRAQTFTPATTVYVGLMTTVAGHTAAGTEVSGGAYARVSLASSLADWAGTQAAASTAVSSGTATASATSNNVAITFPAPTAAWGSIAGFAIFDAATSGNMLFYGALTTAKTVNSGDAAPSFAAASLSLTFDN